MREPPDVRDLMRRGFTGQKLHDRVKALMGGSDQTVDEYIAISLGESIDDVVTRGERAGLRSK